MKFFTIDWWCGLQEFVRSYDPLPDYQAHLATIRHSLPPDLLALQERVSLHDSKLLTSAFDAATNAFEIALAGDDGHGGRRAFRLIYTEVISIRSSASPKKGLPGPHGYGDLGYDEADLTSDGRFEHRMLFSSGIELQVVFGGFTLDVRDA